MRESGMFVRGKVQVNLKEKALTACFSRSNSLIKEILFLKVPEGFQHFPGN